MRTQAAAAAVLLATLSCKQDATSNADKAAAPPLSQAEVERSVYRGHYYLEAGNVKAGTIFIATLDEQTPPLAITAHHIFGTAGGLRANLTPEELVKGFTKGELQHLAVADSIAPLHRPLLIPDAKSFAREVLSTDVAAFLPAPALNKGDLFPLKVAATRPKQGDTVWLAAAIKDDATNTRTHAARVLMSDDDALVFEFVDPKLELRATSGAPIVSSSGEVVGINLTGGTQDGKLVGMAAAMPNAKKRITAALAAEK